MSKIWEWQFCYDSCILTQPRTTGWVSDSIHKGHTTAAPIVTSPEVLLRPLNSRHIKSFHVVGTEILAVQEDSVSPEISEQIP